MLLDPRHVRFPGRANLSQRELAASNGYVSSHAEVGFNGCVEAIETTGADFECVVSLEEMLQGFGFDVCTYVLQSFDVQDMIDCYCRFECFGHHL